MSYLRTTLALAAGLTLAMPVAMMADGNINLGNVSFGITDYGTLDGGNPTTGVNLAGVGDALTPGCLCEAWGVGTGSPGFIGADPTKYGYAGPQTGVYNLTYGAANQIDATHVTTTAFLGDGLGGPNVLQITQAFGPSASSMLLEDDVTITNLTGSTLTGIQFARAMDWDVPPTEFNEYATVQGWTPGSQLFYTSDNGFSAPFTGTAPGENSSQDIGGCGLNVNFTDCGPTDHGAYFIFALPDIAAGGTDTFKIFYGADYTEALALNDLNAVGAQAYSMGQQAGDPTGGTPGSFVFGFANIGGDVVAPGTPEPASLALIGGGLLGVLTLRRRQRKS